MVFIQSTIGDNVFQWLPTNDAMVTIHRSGWVQELFTRYSNVINCVAVTKILIFFAFLTLIHFLFFNCVGSVNHQYQMSCSTFSSLHYFIKFYSSIEIDCCIFFLSEILFKNVLRSFLWIQDFIILGTQDPGILRSWKPRILGSWDFRILIS